MIKEVPWIGFPRSYDQLNHNVELLFLEYRGKFQQLSNPPTLQNQQQWATFEVGFQGRLGDLLIAGDETFKKLPWEKVVCGAGFGAGSAIAYLYGFSVPVVGSLLVASLSLFGLAALEVQERKEYKARFKQKLEQLQYFMSHQNPLNFVQSEDEF